ncbi:MAG: hypothetical protein IPM17_06280 [Verrucomicrobia bacterium]|nr:hypothetical protein [Verrucomicrobiota bacterium]
MSNSSDFELDLDLQLLPAWAREPVQQNKYARFEGESDDGPRGGKGRRSWADREREPRRDRGPRPDRRDRPPRAGSGPGSGGPGGERRPFPGGRDSRDRGPRRDFKAAPRPEDIKPLVPVDINFLPDPKGVDSLARQIKLTGRSYPLFEIATLIMGKPERFNQEFKVRRGPDGQPLQRLFVCSLDESLWLNENEVAQHVLKHHLATFYEVQRVPTDPPKGTYTFVAQCGVTGALLGPPNLHGYQDKLRKIHAERCPHMPFETYKSRVKIVKDEAVVKQWVEEQSFRSEYVCLNVPEPLTLASREDMEAHFRATHLPNLVREVETFVIPAAGPRRVLSPELGRALRVTLEQQRRFPIKVATLLSQQFAAHGLHFFKVNKTVTHVCVSRPHYLDLENTVVSEGVRRIVEFIAAKPGCTRKALIQALAPDRPAAVSEPSVTAPAEPAPAPTPTEAPTAGPAPAAPAPEAAAPAPAEPPAAPAPAPAAPAGPEPTPEQRAVISDLHWLIHQGHVIEFSNGRMELAKKPLPKPPPPTKAPKPAPTTVAPAADQSAETPASETTPTPETQAAAATGESGGTAPAPESSTASSAPVESAVPGEAEAAPAESAPAPIEPQAVTETPPAAASAAATGEPKAEPPAAPAT